MHSRLLDGQHAQILSEETPAPLVESGYHFDKRARTVVVCYVDVDEQNRLIESVAHCFRNFCRVTMSIRNHGSLTSDHIRTWGSLTFEATDTY